MPLRTLLGLILCNLVWSANPAIGKLVLKDFSPAHTAWWRYAGALLAYLVAFRFLSRDPNWKKRVGPALARPKGSNEWGLYLLLGFLTFCFSPLLQMTGLNASKATDNALIVAMEPLMTILLAAIFIKERLRTYHYISFSVAIIGFCLLTGLTFQTLAHGFDRHLWGNLLILFALLGEASFSVLGRKLLVRSQPTAVLGTALAIGVALLTVATFSFQGAPRLSSLGWPSFLAILWLGPLGTALTYLYWMKVLAEVSVASMALTLFIQPVVGAFCGYAFLGERLNLVQSLGGALILVALFVPVRMQRPE